MATRGQILTATGFAIIAGWGGYQALKKKKKKKKAAGTCAPYRFDANAVSVSINTMIDQGADDRDQIAIAVANEHFGAYPGGGTAVFPPAPNAPPGITCVWENTLALVDAIVDARGFEGKPWEIVEEWTSPSGKPTPGLLFRVEPGSGWGVSSVAREALKNAGIPNPKNANNVYPNQLAMMKLIECSPWNDALYGVVGGGGKQGPGGRGIQLNASHADNKQRMLQGLPPRRAATGLSSHDGGGGHLPYLWVPLLEPNAPVPIPAQWTDGRSGINPPVEVLAFGMDNVPPGIYGCEAYQEAAADLPL